jgi:hypothetical protein
VTGGIHGLRINQGAIMNTITLVTALIVSWLFAVAALAAFFRGVALSYTESERRAEDESQVQCIFRK